MVERGLAELEVPAISKPESAMKLARRAATEILSGCLPPYPGAKQIWDFSRRVNDDHLVALDPFVYAASEWEDRSEDRAFFEKVIIVAAVDLLGGEKVGEAQRH